VVVASSVASLDAPALEEAVSVPASALLYHQGRALVYACVRKDVYERREVQVLGRAGNRCVLARRPPELLGGSLESMVGLKPGEAVVSGDGHAQILLSAEFRRDNDDD
jgi:hypothetical protein